MNSPEPAGTSAHAPDKTDPGPTSAEDTASGTRSPRIIRSASDIHSVLAEFGSQGTKTKAVIILALGGIFMDAYDFSSLAFGITAIKEQFGLSGFMTGLVNASIMVGAVIGALFGGYLVDRFGRYKLFMADMVFFVVAAIGCAVAPNEWVLIFFRFIMGIGVGLDLPVAMAFLAEFSKLKGKGNRSQRVNAWSPAWYIATGIGYLVVLIIFVTLPYDQHAILWRIVVGFGAVPALIVLLVRRRYLAESPEWLANQGDLRAAVDVMRSHHNLDVRLADDAKRSPSESTDTVESADTIANETSTPQAPTSQASQPQAPKRGGKWSGFAELFAPQYRVRTIVALCVSVFSTFGYNAVAYGTPLIITTLFHQTPLVTIIASLVINLGFGAIGGLLGMTIVNRFGTRRITLVGFAIQAVALALLAIVGIPTGALVLVSVAMLAAFVFAQAGGPGANLMNYATLSYPTRLRGIGIGFNQSVLRAFSIVSLIMFPILAGSMGTGVFWIVACAPLAGAIAVGIVKWDPTAKDVEEE
ncbi:MULTISPECIES: MFS transporter [Brevibacterium]|uniref:MFS transporter n=1 Tax=Brevibacterium aurantiacum TaxID=273384 RepID=A0A2A3YYV3_BREAU|nr:MULTISPECIES: MFS transporter [Brevibacterium]MDN5607484.1 MFS transporter [Brevibacterium sp.]AZL05417.1 MFS transporter [Brevibacterium aurantiacum]AZL09002.1 MFS transporter [Brevibacterium aurantiacum]AZT93088.1 MFS transporter [Brevibacterium aurantiacum]AZT96871.1 MFS transporter [Brevibacterium aurantiacum]